MQWPSGAPGSANDNLESASKSAWENLESLLSSLGKTTSSLEALLVRLEITATITHVMSLYARLCIYVSMYLCICIVTHLQMVYGDWLQAGLESILRCV